MFQEVKTKKRSLRDVLPPRSEDERTIVAPPQEVLPNRRRPSRRLWWWLVSLGVLIGAVYFISGSLAKVTVEISLAPVDLALNETIVLNKTGGSLNFDIITLPAKVASRPVQASGTEKVRRQASGQIIIYNNYNQEAQKLVANTRFQAKNGKIYRIREAVTVPGMKLVAGKLAAGLIEATVYADQPGAEYNSDSTEFTIPGFKGDPRYTKFSARSKTPLSGGLIGTVPKLSPEEERDASAKLSADLTKELLAEARSKIPDQFILFNGLAFLDIKDVSDATVSTSGTALLKKSATFQGVMLPKRALVERLMTNRVNGFGADEVEISNFDQLKVALVNPASGALAEAKSLTIEVTGSAHAIPIINQADLATKLIGLDREEATTLVSNLKGVAKRKFVFRPFWLQNLPADPSRIEVKLSTG